MLETKYAVDCPYCLTDCISTEYRYTVSTEPFRQCDEKNFGQGFFCSYGGKESDLKPEIWGSQALAQMNKTWPIIPSYAQLIETNYRKFESLKLARTLFTSIKRDYDAFEKDISVLSVYFESPTAMNFVNQASQSWISYLANVGGLLGLCVGAHIITLIELIWLFINLYVV